MLARRATIVAILVLAVLVSACAGRAPDPAPAQPTVAVPSESPQPTVVSPIQPPEPIPSWVKEQTELKAAIREAAARALGRAVDSVEVAQQTDGLYNVAVGFVISGTLTQTTPKSSVAAMRDTAEAEAAALLRGVFQSKPDLANLQLYGKATLQNANSTWQQDALRVSLSAATAQNLMWDSVKPGTQLAATDTWWWLDPFVNVGAASDQQYADKNAAYVKPKS